jgi:hypothetical protein
VRIRRWLGVWLLILLPASLPVWAQSQPDEHPFDGRGGVGGFRFGMSRAEVRMVSDCQPYIIVARTGGLECPNYMFEGRKMNISFIFGDEGLRRIQLWFYEGESESEAREAVGRVIEYLERGAGGVHMPALPGKTVTPDGIIAVLNRSSLQPGYFTQVELSTAPGSQPEVWFSRVARHQFGYAVMLFADPLRIAPGMTP